VPAPLTNPKPARSPRLSSALWLIALAAAIMLHVWFPHIDAGVNDTYNVDAGGRNALYQFAERRALFASRNHESLVTRLDRLDRDTTLCLLGPARYPSPREWDALLNWVQSGGNLLLASRWDEPALVVPRISAQVTADHPEGTGLFGLKLGPSGKPASPPAPEKSPPSEDAAKPASEAAGAETKAVASAASNWTSLMPDSNFTWKTEGAVDAPRSEVLVKSGERPQAARIRYGGGTIVLSASDYIFSNSALFEREKRNGLLAVKLLEAAGARDDVLFDESLNATGTPRVVGVLLDPGLRPTTVQLIVILVIFGWRGNRRFGGLLPKAAPARHDVADHTNSLGNLYYKAHHSKGVLREYLEQLRTELRLRYSAGHEKRALAPIAEKAKLSVDEMQRLLADAEAATRKPKLTRREAASAIRKLALLRQASRKA
jgi:hypothetical protein